MICKYFLPFCELPFHSVDSVVFQITKFKKFKEVQFVNFFPFSCAFGVTSKKSLPNSISRSFWPMFSSKNCIVLTLTCRSLIHFEFQLDVTHSVMPTESWQSPFNNKRKMTPSEFLQVTASYQNLSLLFCFFSTFYVDLSSYGTFVLV